MRKCNFFILTSLYENFRMVYIKAMACCKPVIGTIAGVPKEIIVKETGVLVPLKDINALVEAIDYILDHYQDYSLEKISQCVKKNFSYEVAGEKLDEIYRKIMLQKCKVKNE